jgi:hypothetical protein
LSYRARFDLSQFDLSLGWARRWDESSGWIANYIGMPNTRKSSENASVATIEATGTGQL